MGEVAAHDIGPDTISTGGPFQRKAARSYVAGPKVMMVLGPVRLFGQVLAGGASSDVYPGGFAIQPGAGVDFTRARSVGVRLEVDDWIVPGHGGYLSGPRLLCGLVVRIGSGHP